MYCIAMYSYLIYKTDLYQPINMIDDFKEEARKEK